LGLGSWVLGLGSWVLGLGSWVLGLGQGAIASIKLARRMLQEDNLIKCKRST
jgi:hypothetical protein